VFHPVPKPTKKEKEPTSGQWINGRLIQSFNKKKTRYGRALIRNRHCSNGDTISESQIRSRLENRYKKTTKPTTVKCQCCGKNQAVDHDHSISQKRCKELHKSELIWNEKNWSLSCRTCHMEFESYKDGKFKKHINYKSRMNFIALNDPEGYRKRINFSE